MVVGEIETVKQVCMHDISHDSSNLCPPCHSDTPLAASGSISRIIGQPKKRVTDGTTDGPMDGQMD